MYVNGKSRYAVHYCRHHGHGAYELSGYDLESFGRPGDPVAAACKASAEEVRNG